MLLFMLYCGDYVVIVVDCVGSVGVVMLMVLLMLMMLSCGGCSGFDITMVVVVLLWVFDVQYIGVRVGAVNNVIFHEYEGLYQ